MAELELRHIPWSRSLRILWLLEEIGCDYDLEIVKEGDSLHDALCPVARVPALRDGDITMHETGAMTEWLCETRAPHLGRAPGSAGRPGWLDWLHFGETLVLYVVAVQIKGGNNSDSDEMQRLEHGLGLLGDWIEDSEWLLSDFSGVDCHVGYSLWVTSHVVGLDRHPVLQAYLSRCAARDAFRRAQSLAD